MRAERGFSLIEIMTAMAIMMVVLGLTFRSFSDALKVDDAMKLMTDVDQNLQSASTYLQRDLIDTARNWPSANIPLPSGGTAVAVVRPGPTAAVAAGYPSATLLYPLIPGDAKGPTVGSVATDSVTVCFMDGILGTMDLTSLSLAGTTATMVLANTVTINTRPENTVAVGDIFYIVNGSTAALQRVTAIDAATRTLTFDKAADTMKINQPGVTSGSINPLVALPVTDTKAQRMMMVTYYIEVTGGVPYLMRQSNILAAQAVAIGITNFQLRYNAVLDAAAGTTAMTTTVFGDSYLPSQIDQAFIALNARSDRPLRMSTRYISNDVVTQVGFRSLSTRPDYSVGP
jgi:prepilin-type N-terminal cleavage/methylation domain-containing protein